MNYLEGFRRINIGCAGLVFIIGIIMSISCAFENYHNTNQKPWDEYNRNIEYEIICGYKDENDEQFIELKKIAALLKKYKNGKKDIFRDKIFQQLLVSDKIKILELFDEEFANTSQTFKEIALDEGNYDLKFNSTSSLNLFSKSDIASLLNYYDKYPPKIRKMHSEMGFACVPSNSISFIVSYEEAQELYNLDVQKALNISLKKIETSKKVKKNPIYSKVFKFIKTLVKYSFYSLIFAILQFFIFQLILLFINWIIKGFKKQS